MRRQLFYSVLLILRSAITYSQIPTIDYSRINENSYNEAKNGLWKYFFTDSTLKSEGLYINNRKEGIWKEYWTGGKLKYETNFVNGIPSGSYKTFDEKGRLKGDGQMKGGEIDGIFVSHDTIGKITSISYWEGGQLKAEKNLNDESKPTGTIEIIDGRRYVWIAGKRISIKE